jgi:hypothetical protein
VVIAYREWLLSAHSSCASELTGLRSRRHLCLADSRRFTRDLDLGWLTGNSDVTRGEQAGWSQLRDMFY